MYFSHENKLLKVTFLTVTTIMYQIVPLVSELENTVFQYMVVLHES